MAEKLHAPYSPSGWSAFMKCLLKIYLSHGEPAREKTTYSSEGDIAHALSDYFVIQYINGTPTDQLSILGRPPEASDIDDAMIKHCTNYVRYCEHLVLPHLKAGRKVALFSEQMVILSLDPGIFGTSDFFGLYQDEEGYWHLIIVDLKYGEGIKIYTQENYQLICYLIFAITHFEATTNILQQLHEQSGHPRKEAVIVDGTVHIFQPRMGDNPPPVFYTRDELLNSYWPTMEAQVRKSEEFFEKLRNAPPGTKKEDILTPEDWAQYVKPDDVTCKWCNYASRCKKRADSLGMGIAIDLMRKAAPALRVIKEQMPPELTPTGRPKKITDESTFSNPDVVLAYGGFTHEEMAWIALRASPLKAMIDGIHAAYKKQLDKGMKSPYGFLKAGNPTRTIPEDKEAFDKLLKEKFGFGDFFYQKKVHLGVGELEKIIPKEQLDPLLTQGTVSKSLVPASSGAEPAVPRGFERRADVLALMGIKPKGEESDAEEE